ncbi:thymidylate synthase (FAD) [Micromonospora sp. A200]|uniref:FAD-dependent thymidylate synthase n=1 Tax=Micromonospora sp. A200 TaxID=2940568 RepID=UPI002476A464|nr:FAD-dependent thymidylate synthase [Micromonospora sp. A200]MDH6462092.1 thymidylate synthase (FAD) [Micromonospora sp. A200]
MITYRNDVTILLDDSMGNDAKVIRMAKASIKKTGGDMNEAARQGFIDFLLRERHGVPFEHCAITFYFELPIFVMRQLAKHRISSISEASGRYVELEPVFYLPNEDRNLVQVGKAGAYQFEAGTPRQHGQTQAAIRLSARDQFRRYRELLDAGVAREIARSVLPVSLYTSGYITVNLRSLMNLLSLRTAKDNATIKGHPQHEIELMAEGMERIFAEEFPQVHAAFEKHGRVAP